MSKIAQYQNPNATPETADTRGNIGQNVHSVSVQPTMPGGTVYGGSNGQNHQQRKPRMNESCDKCCEQCCSKYHNFLCIAFCCRNQSRPRRVYIMLFWIVLFFLPAGLIFGLGWLGDRDHVASPADMRWIQEGLSTSFCSGVTVKSSQHAETYLLQEPPLIDFNNVRQSTYNMDITLAPFSYNYWKFYLLSGSKVKIRSCADPRDSSTNFFIVNGKENMNDWENDHYCGDCYLESFWLNRCNQNNAWNEFEVFQSGEYYFVWLNDQGVTSENNITFNVSRTVYDVSNNIVQCTDTEYCELNFEIGDDWYVVVSFPDDISVRNEFFTTICNIRIWFYLIVFLGLPLILAMVSSFVILLCCRKKGGTSGHVYMAPPTVSERQPIITGSQVYNSNGRTSF